MWRHIYILFITINFSLVYMILNLSNKMVDLETKVYQLEEEKKKSEKIEKKK